MNRIKKWAEMVPLLGSDSVYPLDGRWSMTTCICMASEHAASLKRNLNKTITEIRIHQGNIRDSRVIKIFKVK